MISEKIKEYYEKQVTRERKGYFYISEAGDCPRKIYYAMTSAPADPENADGLMKMRAGSAAHERLMGDVYSSGIRVVASEVQIPPNDLISGRCDCIVHMDGHNRIIDFKTISSYGFEQINGTPSKEYVDQMMLYLHFFQVKHGIILYENKNTNELLELDIFYDQKKAEAILERLRQLKEKIDKKEIPEKPNDIPKWKCGYCKFRTVCSQQK